MKHMRKVLCMLLALIMVVGLLPMAALAVDEEEPAVAVEAAEAETTAVELDEAAVEVETYDAVTMDTITKNKSVPLDTSKFYTIFHLDCGRNYFSVQQIKNIIDEMAKDGYNTLELAIGNDGLRLVLDDMSVTANGKTYDSATVANALKSGNSSYRNNGTNQLTQSEMDTIIEYANNKGISIIPLVNAPGHANTMLAIMKAVGISNPAYDSDPRTIDVRNAEAVNFTLALVNKYIQYFAGKGCTIFNMGADEYANTTYSSDSMGFGHLQSAGEYGYYANFVNNMAAQIQNAGMTAMAFNDGIYFNSKTTDSFDSDIAIAYWSSGFGSYIPAPASFLANKGHKIINTNDAWYYVMGRATGTYSYQTAINGAKNTKVTDIPGSNDPSAYGAMVCLWYDYSATYSEKNTFTLLSTLAENNKDYFVVAPVTPPVEDKTVTADNGVSVTAPGLTGVTADETEVSVAGYDKVLAFDVKPETADGIYVGEAKVSVKVPSDWNSAKLTAFVVTDDKVDLIAGALNNGYYSFVTPHFSVMGIASKEVAQEVNQPYDVLVKLKVGESSNDYLETSGTYEVSYPGNLDDIATAKVEVNTIPGETTVKLGNAVSATTANDVQSGTYIVGDGAGHYVMRNGTSVSYTTDINKATQWSLQNNGASFTLKDGNYFFRNRSNTSPSNGSQNISQSDQRVGWYYDRNGLYYGSYHLRWYNGAFNMRNSTSNVAKLYTFETQSTEETKNATVSFTGNREGTTYLTVGNTTYKVVVEKNVVNDKIAVGKEETYTDSAAAEFKVTDGEDNITVETDESGSILYIRGVQVGTAVVTTPTTIYNIEVTPEDLTNVDPLIIEFWITNIRIKSVEDDSTSVSISAETAYGENGIAMGEVVPVKGTYEWAGPDGCNFWKGTHFTSANKQTTAANDDKTTVDDSAKFIRYYGGEWAYSADRITWNSISASDQMVAYYLQATKVTKEVTPMTKDWGLAVGEKQGEDNQVALSLAVVYPDGTLSPAEADIYRNSTLIYNYWSNRDIGIVAPEVNDEYEVEKITVTPGARVSGKSGIFTTASSDGINWEKKTTAAGTEWFNETTYWDETIGGEPMVNGATSNIKWSAANKAYLVLIYLKPVHHDTNLTVQWVDDTTMTTITSQEVVVDYTGDTAPTFLTHIVNNGQTGATAGTIDLKDDAYIVNSSDVHQTFNKDLTTMQNIAGHYTSGLYKYVDADISADGKVLTLHYTMDASKLNHSYVVDFGLPVTVKLSDLISNITNIKGVTTTANAVYNSANKSITYTPAGVLQGTQTVTVRVEYTSGNPTTINVGFVPATTVYYNETFATGNFATKGDANKVEQTAQVAGLSSDEYGYDANVATEDGISGGTYSVSAGRGDKATFTFTGTGVEVYANCDANSGRAAVLVKKADGGAAKLMIVDTSTKGLYGGGVQNGLPIVSLTGLDYGTYTVEVAQATNSGTIALDGFRVFGTMQTEPAFYEDDNEDNPSYVELRNEVLAALNAESATNIYDQVNAVLSGDAAGAVVIDTTPAMGTDDEGVLYTAQDLLEKGPKNELFLAKGQTVAFKVDTTREVQIGIKAVNGTASYTVNGVSKNVSSCTDMFYTVKTKDEAKEKLITITNTGSNLLSITKVKVSDAPSAALATLTEDDVDVILENLGLLTKGDADESGHVTLADVAKAYSLAIKGGVSEYLLKVLDMNGDGKLNLIDVSMLYAKYTGR